MDKPAVPGEGLEGYLGDGLYVSFDGYSITLRAPREGGDHVVSLEPAVYRELMDWIGRYPRLKRHLDLFG